MLALLHANKIAEQNQMLLVIESEIKFGMFRIYLCNWMILFTVNSP